MYSCLLSYLIKFPRLGLIVTGTYLFLMSVLFFRKERHALNGTLACLELLLDTGAEGDLGLDNVGAMNDFQPSVNP